MATILTGPFTTGLVFIPRVPILTTDHKSPPIIFKRRQSPVRLAFALTINKSQGQTLENVRFNLPTLEFTHGQLYVSLSRCTDEKPFRNISLMTASPASKSPREPKSLQEPHSLSRHSTNASTNTNTHTALQQALSVPGPMKLEDDLADRINRIVITQSENGNLGSASTRTFRQAMFSNVYQLTTLPQHHPSMTDSPLCRICQVHMETSRHLLSSCPKKLEIWQGALSRYVEERVWTAEYVCSLFFSSPDDIVPRDGVPLFLLLGAILATVWRYYFAFVRENQAFEL
ncbi:hypothetical protein F5H01DRAFT_400803 [Linnemannia elongata]|nr:hypothetical protein F5H01DRAFT_400803 [Linnemannia elongata]